MGRRCVDRRGAVEKHRAKGEETSTGLSRTSGKRLNGDACIQVKNGALKSRNHGAQRRRGAYSRVRDRERTSRPCEEGDADIAGMGAATMMRGSRKRVMAERERRATPASQPQATPVHAPGSEPISTGKRPVVIGNDVHRGVSRA